MDPANVSQNLDLEPPTAMQRLGNAERDIHRMTGDVSSLLRLGNQQQQQLQQTQQLLQQQQHRIHEQQDHLAHITRLLAQLIPQSQPAAPATASLPATPAIASPPASTAPESPAQATAAGAPEPRIGNPERFNGDPKQVRPFLTSCSLQFSLQPRTFATEGAKVGYTITHLTGRARLWGTAEFERQTPACTSFELFAEEMLKVFDLGSSSEEASQDLLSIRQGRRTVADYSIDFRTLARRSPWNMAALVDVFFASLADYIKDELVSHERPSTLDDAIALAVRIDRRIQTRRRDRGRQNPPATSSRHVPTVQPSSPTTPPNQPDLSEPMEIGRASLSPAERRRRISSNLCLYCGGEGHRVANCPLKAQAHQT